jgi:hypothetical protein
MTWELTKFAEEKFKHTELKTFLSDKTHNFIYDGGCFVLPGMGMGHFYLEDYSGEARKAAGTIFFNENHSVCLHDAVVAEWVKHDRA